MERMLLLVLQLSAILFFITGAVFFMKSMIALNVLGIVY